MMIIDEPETYEYLVLTPRGAKYFEALEVENEELKRPRCDANEDHISRQALREQLRQQRLGYVEELRLARVENLELLAALDHLSSHASTAYSLCATNEEWMQGLRDARALVANRAEEKTKRISLETLRGREKR